MNQFEGKQIVFEFDLIITSRDDVDELLGRE